MSATTTTATTTTTTTATLPNGVTPGRRLRRVLRSMVIGLTPMLGGYWLVMVVTFLVVGLVIQFATGGRAPSIWDYGTQSPKYFSMAVGITLAPAMFTLMVSTGITRRMFSVAAGLFLTGAAVGTALLWVLAYQLENLVYTWQGWPQRLSSPHLFTDTSQVGLVVVEFLLMVLSHEAAGWLIGIAFYRFGFWKGLALLPLALVPAAATELLLVAQWTAQALADSGYQRPPLALGAPAVVAVSALGLYAGYLLLRPLGVKPTKG